MLRQKKHWRTILIIGFLMVGIFSSYSIQIKKNLSSLDEKGNYEDDYLFSGDELQFSGKADNLYFFGKRLTLDGETHSGVTGIGDKIIINGTIGNDPAIAANEIEIKGKINGTAFFLGRNVVIQPEAVINGTIFVLAQNLKLLGTVNGDVYSGTGSLFINGIINGNVKAGNFKLQINDQGKINGNLNYQTDKELSSTEKAKISGKIEFKQIDRHHFDPEKSRRFFHGFFLFVKLAMVFSFMIGALLLLLLPITRKLQEPRSGKNFWQYALWGLIPVLIYPGLILIGFIIPPIAILLILAALPIIFITLVLGITLSGQYLFNLFKWNSTNRYLYFLFGILFYIVFQFIPALNFISLIFFSGIGWGLVLEGLFNKKLA